VNKTTTAGQVGGKKGKKTGGVQGKSKEAREGGGRKGKKTRGVQGNKTIAENAA